MSLTLVAVFIAVLLIVYVGAALIVLALIRAVVGLFKIISDGRRPASPRRRTSPAARHLTRR